MKISLGTASIFALIWLAACSNDADFSGKDSSSSDSDKVNAEQNSGGDGEQIAVSPTSTPTDPPVEPLPASAGDDACDQDKIKINWPNPAIQECMDSGKIWHFPNKYNTDAYCSNVSAAVDYTCDRVGYEDFSSSFGVNTNVLVDRLRSGSKLVSCGQAQPSQGTWAMAQFVAPLEASGSSCAVAAVPTTACFVSGSTGCAEGDFDCIVEWCFDQAKSQ